MFRFLYNVLGSQFLQNTCRSVIVLLKVLGAAPVEGGFYSSKVGLEDMSVVFHGLLYALCHA